LNTKTQSVYRADHSAETALLRVSNDINLALDNHNDVVLVLLDLSSALDTIDQSVLMDRLYTRFGLRGIALAWIKSYLTNRSQAVVIKDVHSFSAKLTCGVPQDSVLGPLLFSLYVPIEDIIIAHSLQSMIFLDDTQMYLVMQRSKQSSCLSKLELCAQDILSWMADNELLCNSSKTEILHFSSCYLQRQPIAAANIAGFEIKTSVNARDIGVTLDQCLTMSTHVSNLCKSASFALKRIGNIRQYLDQLSTEKLVHAFVSSKLDYCNSLLYGLPDKEISKIQRVQNSSARLVTKAKRADHITPILRKLHWLPVRKRLIFKILLFTYKILNGLAPCYLAELINLRQPTRCLRSNNDHLRLHIPVVTTKTFFILCAGTVEQPPT